MTLAETTHINRVITAVHSSSSAGTSAVAASWCRSAIRHGLDPSSEQQRELLSGAELSRLREANGPLLAVARPILDNVYKSVGKTGCCVVLSNADGTILESRALAGDAAMFDVAGLTPGANWSEASEGTNGIGTSLIEARPVTIYRDQHFASRNIGISCIDAPVFDPAGHLVAALDVSNCREDMNEAVGSLVSALVQDAAQRIERDFFRATYAHARIIFGESEAGQGPALLAVDQDDMVIGASRMARLHYHLTDIDLAHPRPAADILGHREPAMLGDSERMVLRQALARSGGNASEAARLLGIGRATLYRRLKRAHIIAH